MWWRDKYNEQTRRKRINYLVVLPEEEGDETPKIIYCKTYEVAVKLRDSVEGAEVYTKQDYMEEMARG